MIDDVKAAQNTAAGKAAAAMADEQADMRFANENLKGKAKPVVLGLAPNTETAALVEHEANEAQDVFQHSPIAKKLPEVSVNGTGK